MSVQKDRNKTQSIIFLILTILWVCVIFSFSLQNGEESSQLSGGIVAYFVEWIAPEGFTQVEVLELLIRKGAHFTEYFILGGLILQTIRAMKGKKSILFSWIIGTMVACCDEIIQLFSDGRAGQITDVMLDSRGVFAGCLLLYFLFKRIKG